MTQMRSFLQTNISRSLAISAVALLATATIASAATTIGTNITTAGVITSTNTGTDRDGLLDADEKKYGSSSQKADSDADSYVDGVEVRNGYSPVGVGKL